MNKDEIFEKFDREVMLSIISENELYREKLSGQYMSAKVIGRKFTGHGFYTNFEIVDKQFRLGDINDQLGNTGTQLNDMKNGVGFVLFIKNGIISCLEGYAYNEPWPDEIYEYRVSKPL